MKRIILFSIISILFFNCKKDSATTSLQNDLFGKWELKIRKGGWIGTQNYPEGNGNILVFGSDTYTKSSVISGNNYSEEGTYDVYSGIGCEDKEIMFIKFASSGSDYVQEISITNGELILSEGCLIADGVTSTYRKIQ